MLITKKKPLAEQARAKTGVGAHGHDDDDSAAAAVPPPPPPPAAAAGNAGGRAGSTVNVVVSNNLGDGGVAANVSGWEVVNETMPYFYGGGRCETPL